MKLTRNLLGLAIGITAVGSPATLQAGESSRVIEEIVVTSRRQEESVQDVPLSVTAFAEERIEQLKPTTLRDFDGLSPNVYIGMNTAGPSASAIYIRGVGYADIEKTQTPQVGVIVDGIQMGSSTGQLVDVFDVESIEINRGPQGVLFGKNTIGGNIVVNRVRPQFNDFGVTASYEAGNYDSSNFKARVNIPLIEDTLALKIGGIVRERDGYYDNLTLGQSAGDVEFESYTAALRWAPTDNFDAIVTYDVIDDTSQIPPQDPRFDGDDPFVNLADKEEPTDYDVDQLGIRATWDVTDNITLYSISGWHDGDDQVNQDFDGAAIDGGASPFAQLHTLRTQEFEVFTQELRAHIEVSDSVDVMAGFYYYDSELEFEQRTNNVLQVPFGLPPGVPCVAVRPDLRDNPNPAIGNALCQFANARSTQIAGEDVESTAFFGSITWRPTDEWEVLVGVRNIQEEKDAFNSYFDHTTGIFDTTGPEAEHDFSPYPTTAGTAYAVDDDWDDTIWTASVSYEITNTNRVYVNYSEGFRSGGFSIRSARDPAEAAFDPEDAEQVEIGIKNEFLDGTLQLNLAYYELDRSGSQFSSIITLPPGSIPGTTTLINNGKGSTYDGWELEGLWAINDNFTLTFNAGTLDVDNKEFTIVCEQLDGCTAGGVLGADPPGTLRTLGGNDDSRQPEWSASASIAYAREWGPGTFYANVGYKKVGNFLLVNTGGGADQRLFEGGYGQWDARIAYDWNLTNGATLSLSAYGRNLSDEEWREQALFLGGFLTGFQGWGAPQTGFFEIRYSM